MPSTVIDGRSYFYEDRGEGEPLLLLHGFPFSSESWWPQLESPPKGVRIIAPDHRGFGKSAPGPLTMESMAEDAIDLLDVLGLGSAYIGGCSMGGYVAIALTRIEPSRVRGLLLVDTQSSPDDEEKKHKREEIAQQAEREGTAGIVNAMLPNLVHGKSPRLEKIMRTQSAQAVAAASRAMALRSDGKDILSRYSGRCAIVVGADDTLIPVEQSKALNELINGSSLHVIEGAKHLPNIERPVEFGAVIEGFVQG